MAEPKLNKKTKKYEGLVYEGKDAAGKRKYHFIVAESKREWRQLEAEFKAHRNDSRRPTITVGECVENYITSREGTLSPASIRGYRSDQKKVEQISAIRVSDLTAANLQFWVSDMAKRLAPKTVRNVYSLAISAIGMVDDRRFRVTLPAKRPVIYNTPTTDQVKMLLDSAKPDMRIAILLASVGSLRRGEICALDYSDVASDSVFVHRAAVIDEHGKVIIRDIPKTSGSVRRVQMPKEVMVEIGKGEGLVFKRSPSALESEFRRLRDGAGLKCRFHDLRHYSASILHAIGVPDQYIMERGGWSDDRVLKAVYRNTLEDQSRAFSEKANKYFSKAIFN